MKRKKKINENEISVFLHSNENLQKLKTFYFFDLTI